MQALSKDTDVPRHREQGRQEGNKHAFHLRGFRDSVAVSDLTVQLPRSKWEYWNQCPMPLQPQTNLKQCFSIVLCQDRRHIRQSESSRVSLMHERAYCERHISSQIVSRKFIVLQTGSQRPCRGSWKCLTIAQAALAISGRLTGISREDLQTSDGVQFKL